MKAYKKMKNLQQQLSRDMDTFVTQFDVETYAQVLGRRLIKEIRMWADKIVSNLEFVSSLVF